MLLTNITTILVQTETRNSPGGVSLIMVEGALTLIAVALAFWMPRMGANWFLRIESLFARLARRRSLAVVTVGLSAALLRLAILPLVPMPLPFVPDDFSFLLGADTFAHGRLTNPTPVMWTHFESIHITMVPSYMSMYFPSNGLVLAASTVLFGHPWFGLLITNALMCAALCWMLQAWLPPGWALLGGLLAVLRLGLFSYWINTFSGGGSIAALGGALVLGALPRLIKTDAESKSMRLRYGLLLAIGIILLATTRPYEGLLLCLPAAGYLVHWILFGKNRPRLSLLLRQAALPVALLVAAGAWMGYYDYRAFGSPTTLPYTVDRATYAMAPYYVWQSPRPEPVYRHAVMRRFYYENELVALKDFRKPSGFVETTVIKIVRAFLFYAGIALLPALFFVRRIFLDRRIRFLVLCIGVLVAGMLIQIFMIPHYLAPFTAVFYAIGLQAMRHLRVWKPGDMPVGTAMVRFTVVVCLIMGGLRLSAEHLRIMPAEFPASEWSGEWYGPSHYGTRRAQVEAELEHLPSQQLVLVRYTPKHNPLDEWVYNGAEIDSSKVIWAREMDSANNAELIRYYKDRRVWLVQPDMQPDKQPATLIPYSAPEQLAAAGHEVN
jgi:hypothetical protein